MNRHDDDEDDGLTDILRHRCCIPNCRHAASGLYCRRHLAQLALLDCEPGEAPDDPPDEAA